MIHSNPKWLFKSAIKTLSSLEMLQGFFFLFILRNLYTCICVRKALWHASDRLLKASHALKSSDSYQTVPIQNPCFDVIVFFLSSHKFCLLLHPQIQQKKTLRQIFWGFTEEEKEVLHIFHELLFRFLLLFSGLASIYCSVVSDFRLVERTDPYPHEVVLY